MADTKINFSIEQLSNTHSIVRAQGRTIHIIGTAHVSAESVEQTKQAIQEIKPKRVCIEIDQERYQSIISKNKWRELDLFKIIRQRKGFLLLVNLVLASFQKRIGIDNGVNPGEEMVRAIEQAESLKIPISLIDRPVEVTLRRTWRRCGFFAKMKLLASLFASIFNREKISEEDIERLKTTNVMRETMDELANYLPQVKNILINERDEFLANAIYLSEGDLLVAIVGAGHVDGMLRQLEELHLGSKTVNNDELLEIPAPNFGSKAIPWLIPTIVGILFILGFSMGGREIGLNMIYIWILLNGSLALLGALLALAHPLTMLVAFVSAPITSLNPTIGAGIVAALMESIFRKPRVKDLENIMLDSQSLRGWYSNRISRILLVLFMVSIGSSIASFVSATWISTLL